MTLWLEVDMMFWSGPQTPVKLIEMKHASKFAMASYRVSRYGLSNGASVGFRLRLSCPTFGGC